MGSPHSVALGSGASWAGGRRSRGAGRLGTRANHRTRRVKNRERTLLCEQCASGKPALGRGRVRLPSLCWLQHRRWLVARQTRRQHPSRTSVGARSRGCPHAGTSLRNTAWPRLFTRRNPAGPAPSASRRWRHPLRASRLRERPIGCTRRGTRCR